nr:thiamine pyrophosphate-dependent enzyme [Candidatus Sigynarchaeota archaeon]
FIEDFSKKLAFEVGAELDIEGKRYFSRKGELNLTSTITGLAKFMGIPNPFINMAVSTGSLHKASPRPPVLCPGCSHRSTLYAMKLVEQKSGKNFVYSGDIGCYTLGFYKPTEAIETCICMGASIGLANGIGKLHDGPVFALIGDSTFFHAGIPGLIDAVYNQNDIIVMLLDNSVTAMTGFQPHPGTGILITGEQGTRIPPEQIVLGTGVKQENLWIVDSNDLAQITKAIEQAIAKKGPRVIISRHACALYEAGISKKKPTPVCIDKDKCTNCMICIKNFGCPALTLSDENEVTINEMQCNGCGVCVNICPSDAIKPKS